MKKFHIALFAFVLTMLGVNAQVLSFTYTPNGTYVPGSPGGELSSWDCSNINSIMASQYPSATIRRRATARYNCHGFAWHMSNTGSATSSQKIWINAPNLNKYQTSAYGGDNSYGASGEVNHAKAHYYSGDHSANVRTGGTYRSKWGAYPLVDHTRYNVPTIYQASFVRWFFRSGSGFNSADDLDLNQEPAENGVVKLDWFVNSELSDVYAFKIVRMEGESIQAVSTQEIPRIDLAKVGPEGEHYVVEVPANEANNLYLQLLGAPEGHNLVKF